MSSRTLAGTATSFALSSSLMLTTGRCLLGMRRPDGSVVRDLTLEAVELRRGGGRGPRRDVARRRDDRPAARAVGVCRPARGELFGPQTIGVAQYNIRDVLRRPSHAKGQFGGQALEGFRPAHPPPLQRGYHADRALPKPDISCATDIPTPHRLRVGASCVNFLVKSGWTV